MAALVFKPSLIDHLDGGERELLKVAFTMPGNRAILTNHIEFFTAEISKLDPEGDSFAARYRELQTCLKVWRGMLDMLDFIGVTPIEEED